MRISTSGVQNNVSTMIATRRFDISPFITTIRDVLDSGDYTAAEASVNLPFDTALHDAVERLVGKLRTPELKYVFLVGIGGSNLGAKAVYDTFFSYRDLTAHADPRLICIDTTSEPLLIACKQIIATLASPQEYVLISISKSGGTTETITNTEIVMAELAGRLGPAPDRLVVISDAGSPFIVVAKAWGAHTLGIPKEVGGRYSVFSAVGLVPLALCGINIRELARGAEAACMQGSHTDVLQNQVAQSALVAVDAYQNGKTIHDMFLFHPELESLGKWWRQLVGESIGKSTTEKHAVTVGITPTVSIGSTDLHSVGQLYLGGPADKLVTFVYTTATHNFSMPTKRIFPTLVEMVSGKKVSEVLSAIRQGTTSAFLQRERPFIQIELEMLSPYELGQFMQYKMIETMYIGRLLQVNPFDQPDVELYKTVTKELLEQSK